MRAEAEDPGLVLRMAKAEAELGRAGRVEALLERATSRQPRDPNTWVQSGLVRDRLGRTDQAAADFARAIELLPRDRFFASPRSWLILELAGHERVFSALLEARPDDKHLWIGRGRYHALRDRWRQAAADYARGIEPVASPGTDEYYEYACLLLLVGDKGRYRGLIQTLGEPGRRNEGPSAGLRVGPCLHHHPGDDGRSRASDPVGTTGGGKRRPWPGIATWSAPPITAPATTKRRSDGWATRSSTPGIWGDR